jgi:uncharacterized protein YwqG
VYFKKLIDEAYEIIWKKLSLQDRLKIDLGDRPYNEPKLLEALSEMYRLQGQQKEIRKLARPAILLRTVKGSEAKIPIGATKIGGKPDLPTTTEWPAFTDGRPLAFLAQIDLSALAKLKAPLKGLPAIGLLSVFSVWGWMPEGSGDPDVPSEGYGTQEGWTVALYTPTKTKLERRKTPKGVKSYKAAPVELLSIMTLPNHRVEPPLAALQWHDDVLRRFDDMQSAFRSVQMGHWLKNPDAFASAHTLGGYAVFQQQFPQQLLDSGRTMLLQIGSDSKTEMGWGDGGELTFYADTKALAKGRFERLWGDCQGG